jgi:hypothetical protein
LLYAAINTRIDINFATNQASLFVEKPGKQHWDAVLKIFAYLRKTSELGILLSASPEIPTAFEIDAYCDASYANIDGSRSTTGYVIYLNSSPVAWRSKTQIVIALSTTEAEYMALAEGVKEILWLKQLLVELDILPIGSCRVFEDNQAAINLAENPVLHQKTKHIEIRFHFLRSHVGKDFELLHIDTKNQDADGLTKAQHLPELTRSRDRMMN